MHPLRNRLLASVLGCSTVLTFAASASAAPFSFAQDTGQNSAFGWQTNYTNGGHSGASGPVMGTPTITPDGFFFQNDFGDMDFLVEVGESLNSVTRWRMSNIDSAQSPGSSPAGAPAFNFIRVRESGVYNSNDPLNDFSITQTFSVFRFAPVPPGTTGSIDLPAVTFNPDGTWETEYVLLVGADSHPNTGLAFQTIEITLTNILQVSGNAPEGTFIEKTFASVITPEPGTLALLVLAAPLVIRRKRK